MKLKFQTVAERQKEDWNTNLKYYSSSYRSLTLHIISYICSTWPISQAGNKPAKKHLPNSANVTFLGWWFVTVSKVVGDLQLGDKKITLNHLAKDANWLWCICLPYLLLKKPSSQKLSKHDVKERERPTSVRCWTGFWGCNLTVSTRWHPSKKQSYVQTIFKTTVMNHHPTKNKLYIIILP